MRIGVQVGEKIDPLCQRGEKILPVKQLCRFQVFRISRQAVQLVERVPQPAELIDGVRPGAAQNPVDFPIGKPAEAFPDAGSQRAGQPQRLAVVQQARAVCQSLQNFMDGIVRRPDVSVLLPLENVQRFLGKCGEEAVWIGAVGKRGDDGVRLIPQPYVPVGIRKPRACRKKVARKMTAHTAVLTLPAAQRFRVRGKPGAQTERVHEPVGIERGEIFPHQLSPAVKFSPGKRYGA